MPYVKKGNTIYKKVGDKLVKKGSSSSSKKAKSYLRVLNAVEHGWKPSSSRKGWI